MKRIWITVLCLLSVFLTSACRPEVIPITSADNASAEQLTKADHSAEKTDEAVSFRTEYEKYSPEDTMIFGILKNSREQSIAFSHAHLEWYNNGEWYVLSYKADMAETQELPTLPGDKETVCGVNAALYAHTLTKGRYRLAVCYNDLLEYYANSFTHVVFAEFEVTDKEDTDRIVFKDLEDEALDRTAADDGCVVVEGDQVFNETAAALFIYKALLNLPCEMRVVSTGLRKVRHIRFTGRGFITESCIYGPDGPAHEMAVCSYIAEEDGWLLLTNCADPHEADSLGFDRTGDIPVLPLNEETLDQLKKTEEERKLANITIMRVYLDTEWWNYVSIAFMVNDEDAASRGRFSLGVGSSSFGASLGDIYEEGLRPAAVKRASDTTAEITFTDETGVKTKRYLDVTNYSKGLITR